MIKVLLIFTFTSITLTVFSQDYSKNNFEYGQEVTIDNENNIYTIGSFRGQIEQYSNKKLQVTNSIGSIDLFVRKTDQHGNLIWLKTVGGKAVVIGKSLKLDAQGNLYLTGEFSGTSDFNPGLDTFNLISNVNKAVFILKLNDNGDFLWAKAFGSSQNLSVIEIALDESKNIYTTGVFRSTIDVDPSDKTANIHSSGWDDIYIQKLNQNGEFIWAKSIGSSGFDDRVSGISIDSHENVHLIGDFREFGDFDPGPNVYRLESNGWYDCFVLKLNALGEFVWAKNIGGSTNDSGYSITNDDFGNSYISGHFGETADFDPSAEELLIESKGDFDAFIQKLDANGNNMWVKQIGGDDSDLGGSIRIDSAGHVYQQVVFRKTVQFDDNKFQSQLHFDLSIISRMLIQKLDTSGNFIWARIFGGYTDDYLYLHSFGVDKSGQLFTNKRFTDLYERELTESIKNIPEGFEGLNFHRSSIKMNKTTTVVFIESSFNLPVVAYWNPKKGELRIDFQSKLKKVKFNVKDENGNILISKTSKGIETVDSVMNQKPGYYFVELLSKNQSALIRLFRE